MTTPSLLSPSTGAIVGNDTQPIKLTVQTATGGKSNATLTYTFQVATDAAFATVIATKTAPQGVGQTSVTLDVLTSGRDYFWRVKASSSDAAGEYSLSFKFTIGADVKLGTPVAVSPLTGSTADPKPRLTVSNVSHSESTGAMFYRFDISSTSSFSTVLTTATVPERYDLVHAGHQPHGRNPLLLARAGGRSVQRSDERVLGDTELPDHDHHRPQSSQLPALRESLGVADHRPDHRSVSGWRRRPHVH